MQETTRDHPNVIVFPPVILVATVALACILQWLLPLALLQNIDRIWRVSIGAVVILAGVYLAVAGRRTLMRLRTNVSPLLPTTTLATSGIYKRTRNPLYTGGTLVMLGIALVFALDWLVLLIGPSTLLLHLGVVSREEQYLERKFGDDYRQYKLSVSRYGFRF